jgi:predicted DNA-binding transcriptional regulator YafY
LNCRRELLTALCQQEKAVRRADRLFQIIQILRRTGRPVTADTLAKELEVSKRSVYRDVADLIGQRVPIQGEAGLGYILDSDFDMPPLMLTPDEVEAAVLGAQLVVQRGDPVLARAARDLIAKVATAVPERLRPFITEPTIGAPPAHVLGTDGLDIAKTRLRIRNGRKIKVRYRNQETQDSERIIWPVIIGYAETVRLLAAWCELRRRFRHFRTDRILSADFLEESYGYRPSDLRARWKREFEAGRGVRLS